MGVGSRLKAEDKKGEIVNSKLSPESCLECSAGFEPNLILRSSSKLSDRQAHHNESEMVSFSVTIRDL